MPETPPPRSPALRPRQLGLPSAVAIGLSSMLGAGVFAVWGPAAAAAGSGPALLTALALAAAIAYCNAISSTRLAARHRRVGGAYVWGAQRLHPAAGFAAGWLFLAGKTASAAAMALTLGHYLLPEHPRALGVVAVAVMCAVNLLGVKKTTLASTVFAGLTIAVLLTAVVAGITGPSAGPGLDRAHPWGLLTAAGFLFFAFTGYARVATLGEEVRRPERTIPRAVPIALGAAVVLYAVVAGTAVNVLGLNTLARSTAPLADLAAASAPALEPLVAIGAGVAAAGVLLGLLAAIGRTALAMARDRRLPNGFTAVSHRFGVPWAAEVTAAALVLVVVAAFDLAAVIGFSSFCILLYYSVANAAAVTIDRRSPVPWAGLAGCLLMAAALPPRAVLAGLAALALGGLWYALTGSGRRAGS